MMLHHVLVLEEPRDLTPAKASAHRYLRSAIEIARTNGLGRLDKHLLPSGDVEVRYWGGFAWGTRGVRLRREGGKWTVFSLERGRNQRPKRLPDPRSGWPTFWSQVEKLGLWSISDEDTHRNRRGYATIFDGYSTLVEYQRDGVYRAYAYNNPGNQSTWPPSKPMAALSRFIESNFPMTSNGIVDVPSSTKRRGRS